MIIAPWRGGRCHEIEIAWGGLAAALPFVFSAGSANAVTFDVTGKSIDGVGGISLTGTIDGDAALTVINSINLQRFPIANPFNVINSYVPFVLHASSTPPTVPLNITLFFSSTDMNDFLNAQGLIYFTTLNQLQAQANVAAAACNGDEFCLEIVDSDLTAAKLPILINGQRTFGALVVAEAATTPLPAALPLFASGAGVLGFFGWRRKKKAAALAA